MLKLIKNNSICNDYSKNCERCGEEFIIHLFPGVKKSEADKLYKYCINCKNKANYTQKA